MAAFEGPISVIFLEALAVLAWVYGGGAVDEVLLDGDFAERCLDCSDPILSEIWISSAWMSKDLSLKSPRSTVFIRNAALVP